MDPRNEEQWRIDVSRIVHETRLQQPLKSSEACIFRVPKFLVDINPKAYVPQVVSLGPLHWKTLCTQILNHKAEAVDKMLINMEDKDINFVVGEIRGVDANIRSCYDEVIECSAETLAWMMTLDGCFLLHFLRSWTENSNPISIFSGNRSGFLGGFVVLQDIMMLENQIPLCVVVKLLQLEFDCCEMDAQEILCDWAYSCVSSVAASSFNFPNYCETLKNPEAKVRPRELINKSGCLLDFLRLCMESFLNIGQQAPSPVVNRPSHPSDRMASPRPSCCPFCLGCADFRRKFLPPTAPILRCRQPTLDVPCIFSARNLKIAGIEIKPSTGDGLNQIRFENKGLLGASLFLPKFLIQDTTETVIRNVLALEECRASLRNPITRHIQLMHSLVDAREDVSLLVKNGVILNCLGSEEDVATLFNNLVKGTTENPIPEFDHVLTQVRDYHDAKWNVVIAEFVHKNFSSPWVTLSVVAAILMLLMSSLQTFYSVYSAYNK